MLGVAGGAGKIPRGGWGAAAKAGGEGPVASSLREPGRHVRCGVVEEGDLAEGGW